MVCPIVLKTKEDVVRVSNVAAKADSGIMVSCGSVMIDPRSILGLFALLGKEAVLVAPDNFNPNYFKKLVKKMGVA